MVSNYFCVYLLSLLFAAAALVVYGGEQCLIDHLKINTHDYSVLKKAVFNKRGQEYKEQFKRLYTEPSAEGILYLAESFDEGSCTEWGAEANVQVTYARIDGIKFKITGVIAEVVQIKFKLSPDYCWGY